MNKSNSKIYFTILFLSVQYITYLNYYSGYHKVYWKSFQISNTSKKIIDKIEGLKPEKWIIVSTEKSFTNELKKLSEMNGFKLLIVSSKQFGLQNKNIKVLDSEFDMKESFGIKKYVRFTSHSRKNFGIK